MKPRSNPGGPGRPWRSWRPSGVTVALRGPLTLALFLVCEALSFGFVLSSFSFLVGPWSTEFGLATSTLMLCITTTSFACVPFGLALGWALDRYSVKYLIVSGSLIYALALLALSHVTAAWQIFAIYALLLPPALILLGPGTGQILATRWFPRHRGAAIGIVVLGTSMGGAIVPAVLAEFIHASGWRHALWWYAMSAFALSPALVMLLDDKGAAAPKADGDLGRDTPALDSDARRWTYREILSSAEFWRLMVCLIPLLALFTALQTHVAGLAASKGLSLTDASSFASALAIGAICSKPMTGFLVDRVDYSAIVAFAAALTAAGVAMVSATDNVGWLVVLFGLMGFATGMATPLLGGVLSYRFGVQSLGKAMGLATVFVPIASLAAPAVALLHAGTGDYGAALTALSLTLLATLAAAATRAWARLRWSPSRA